MDSPQYKLIDHITTGIDERSANDAHPGTPLEDEKIDPAVVRHIAAKRTARKLTGMLRWLPEPFKTLIERELEEAWEEGFTSGYLFSVYRTDTP